MRTIMDVTYIWDPYTWVHDVHGDFPHHLTQVRKPVSPLLQELTHQPIPVESTGEMSLESLEAEVCVFSVGHTLRSLQAEVSTFLLSSDSESRPDRCTGGTCQTVLREEASTVAKRNRCEQIFCAYYVSPYCQDTGGSASHRLFPASAGCGTRRMPTRPRLFPTI